MNMNAKALMQKINNKHFLSLAGNFIMAILGVVTVAILYRALSENEIGSWIFFQAAFVLVDTFRTGFLQTALITFYAGATAERAAEVVGSTWYVGLIITGISIVLTIPAWLCIPFISNQGIIVTIQWFSITFCCTLPIVMATWVLQAKQRFDYILYIRLVNQGSFIIMVLLLIWFKKCTLQHVFIANVLGCFFTLLLTFITGWAELKFLKNKTIACVKEIFHFGKYSVGTTISANLLRSSDTFIINFMIGPAAVAVYNLAQRLMEIIEIPLRSFLATGMPAISTEYNQKNMGGVSYFLNKYAGMLAVALIPIAIGGILLADVAIAVLGGSKYEHTEAANIFRIFLSFAVFLPIDRFLGITLDVINQPKLNFIKVILMLAINIIGDFVGIHLTGSVYGVALASIPNFMAGVLFGYFALKRFMPVSIKNMFTVGYAEFVMIIKSKILKY